MTNYLTVERVIELNAIAGGPGESGVLDRGGLEGAVARPRTSAGGLDAFTSLFDKVGALVHGISGAQYFIDGNKRTGWLAGITFLRENGVPVRRVPDVEAEAFMLSLSAGATDHHFAAEWFHSVVDRGPVHRRSNVRLLDVTQPGGVIADATFEMCTLFGPAMVVLAGDTLITRCSWEGGATAADHVVEVEDDRERVVGPISLVNCVLDRCTLVGVGVIVPKGMAQRFFDGVMIAGGRMEPPAGT